jgi:putative nucleotide binding protein
MEDYAIILDYLPLGYIKEGISNFKRRPVAQAIGKEEYTLLELTPKEGENLEIHDEVYIGAGKREKISRVSKRLRYDDLTAGPISTRLHQLELLPGIGKKHMWDIIKAREEKPFENFEDIKNRVPMLSDPVKLIVKRILLEMDVDNDKRGKRKYIIFTRPPTRPRR